MILLTSRAAASRQIAELGKKYPFAKDAGSTTMIVNSATRERIADTMLPVTGAKIGKGNLQSSR